MTDKRVLVERREHKRFPVRQGVYVVNRSKHIKAGQMIDVNVGGLAFLYSPHEELSTGPPKLYIFSGGKPWFCRTPFRTVWDQKAKQESSGTAGLRLCGVQFGELTDAERLQLEYFIQHHVTCVVI
jgi:hypothetical protein